MSRAGHYQSRRHRPHNTRPPGTYRQPVITVESDQLQGWRADRAEAAASAAAARTQERTARRQGEHDEADDFAAQAALHEAAIDRIDVAIAKFGGQQ